MIAIIYLIVEIELALNLKSYFRFEKKYESYSKYDINMI